ncbi:MAG: response regulator [Geminicoccaceae bacterium]|nr:response regulator [Geminicoccaceae bacterium]MCX8101855.1 response regulator [Geminicoccaceae bacterium]MDW8369803.1 response regulator [Geminicoccaceae bacterium]
MDESRGPQRRRLLIVGDPALSRGLMRMVLSRLGYVVSVVSSGTEALTMRAHTRFALALVAARLPDMPGLVLARHLGASPAAPVPVLLFGDAFDQPAIEREGRTRWLAGFLVKPISIGRLVAAVRMLTDGDEPGPGATELVMPLPTPIDLARLREFTDGDIQLERELTALYLETAKIYIGQMRDSLDDPDSWQRAAHSLKGASVNIGAVELAELAATAERAEPSVAIVDELLARLGAVKGFLEAHGRPKERIAAIR